MRTESMPSVAIASWRASFQLVAHEVSAVLASASNKALELPEAERAQLLSAVHELDSVQLRLRRQIGQLQSEGTASVELIETVMKAQLGLLTRVTAFAERVGLRVQNGSAPVAAASVSGGPAAYEQDVRAILAAGAWPHAPGYPTGHIPAALPPGVVPVPYYYPVPHPGPYAYPYPPPEAYPHPRRRRCYEDHWDDDDAEYERRRRRRARRNSEVDDEPRRGGGATWLRASGGTGGLGGVGLMLAAVSIISGIAFADQIFGRSAPDSLAEEQLDRPPDAASATAAPVRESGRAKMAGRIADLPGAGQQPEAEVYHTQRTARPLAVTNLTPAAAAPSTRVRVADFERDVDMMLTTGAVQRRQPKTHRASEADVLPNPPRATKAQAPKLEVAAAVVPPAAKPKLPVPKAAAPETEPEETPAEGGLFVPVLSTHKDQKAALEAFAELQKQHAGVLGAKQSEVQSSSGESGTWHRLVVTPATSKQQATELCNKLRAAGYGRCWVKPY